MLATVIAQMLHLGERASHQALLAVSLSLCLELHECSVLLSSLFIFNRHPTAVTVQKGISGASQRTLTEFSIRGEEGAAGAIAPALTRESGKLSNE